MKDSKKSETLLCFNPIVTLLTGVFEILCAIAAGITYTKTLFGRIAVLTLICLAIFQFSEFTICSAGAGMISNKIGYIAIAFLPALGLHLASLLTRTSILLPISYIAAIIISVSIAFLPTLFVATYCTGTFVLFELNTFLTYAFGIYYMLFILIAMIKLSRALIHKVGRTDVIAWLLVGYLSFLIPTLTVSILYSSTRSGIPSIMCGFAVLLAAILTFKVLPLYHEKTHPFG